MYINISIAIFIYVLYGTWDCSSQPLGVFQTLWAPYLDSYLIHLILFSDLNLFESVNGKDLFTHSVSDSFRKVHRYASRRRQANAISMRYANHEMFYLTNKLKKNVPD